MILYVSSFSSVSIILSLSYSFHNDRKSPYYVNIINVTLPNRLCQLHHVRCAKNYQIPLKDELVPSIADDINF